jgi:hypothetical protein
MGVHLVKSRLRSVVASSPLLYTAIARRRRGRNRRIVDRSTDLLVEGHPRSGNTFALAWISCAWPELVVASHVHHPAHIARANKLRIPSLVIVRPPMETVLSMLIYSGSDDVLGGLQRWMDFYRSPCLQSELVHVEPFEQVRSSMPSVMERFSRTTGFSAKKPTSWPQDADVFAAVTDLGNRRFGSISDAKLSIPTPSRLNEQDRKRPLFESPAAKSMLEDADGLLREVLGR